MNFWAKLLNVVTNIFIVLGILIAFVSGVEFLEISILLGLAIIAGGVLGTLLSACLVKILIFASEDLTECREYLYTLSRQQSHSRQTHLTGIANNAYKQSTQTYRNDDVRCGKCNSSYERVLNSCPECGFRRA